VRQPSSFVRFAAKRGISVDVLGGWIGFAAKREGTEEKRFNRGENQTWTILKWRKKARYDCTLGEIF